MYLSRVFLNPERRVTREWVTSPQRMHAAVLAGFPESTADNRPLWRLDKGPHRFELLMVSGERPDLMHLVENGGWSTRPPDVADYRPFLDRLEVGRRYLFRLRANTVRSTKDGVEPGARGRVVNVGSRALQERWLADRAGSLGFAIPSSEEDLRSETGGLLARRNLALTERGIQRFSKNLNGSRIQVTLATAQFDGLLEVTDPSALRGALTGGIGRGKAYGCGLLTLAPIS
jgi:CRISPR system Cascade subunit CasE